MGWEVEKSIKVEVEPGSVPAGVLIANVHRLVVGHQAGDLAKWYGWDESGRYLLAEGESEAEVLIRLGQHLVSEGIKKIGQPVEQCDDVEAGN